ncbi:MAG: ECF transporter S component [Oscillospiraceae bacterium]|nr:ECF transporter S component [Candidatus Limimonas coprohippi]MCQ2488874.1 ECF transporter S component [Clostridia bacterium]
MSKKSLITILTTLILAPALIVLTWKFNIHYYITGTLMVILCMIPFFISFEDRKPEARELVVIAVLVALSVASRAAFIAVPMFKPVIGMIMIAGFAFGSQAGFLTGAMTALISNFIFGQGAWTPWQMFSWGLSGLIAGFLSKKGLVTGNGRVKEAISGFLIVLLVVGPALDTSSVLTMLAKPTLKSAWPFYVSGFPANISLAICTVLTLVFLSKPMLEKLNRIKLKYGMME